MGSRNTHFAQVPDNEFTRSAILLKSMGIKLVIFEFHDLLDQNDEKSSVMEQYTPEAREKLAQALSEKMSETVSSFVVALIPKGVSIAVTCPSSQQNGEVAKVGQVGYIYQGQPLLENVFIRHFGPDLAPFVTILETRKYFSAVKQAMKSLALGPSEVLIIHPDPETVRKARKLHMSAILVEDHKLGFRV